MFPPFPLFFLLFLFLFIFIYFYSMDRTGLIGRRADWLHLYLIRLGTDRREGTERPTEWRARRAVPPPCRSPNQREWGLVETPRAGLSVPSRALRARTLGDAVLEYVLSLSCVQPAVLRERLKPFHQVLCGSYVGVGVGVVYDDASDSWSEALVLVHYRRGVTPCGAISLHDDISSSIQLPDRTVTPTEALQRACSDPQLPI